MKILCFVIIRLNIAKCMWTELLALMILISVVLTAFCVHAENIKELKFPAEKTCSLT